MIQSLDLSAPDQGRCKGYVVVNREAYDLLDSRIIDRGPVEDPVKDMVTACYALRARDTHQVLHVGNARRLDGEPVGNVAERGQPSRSRSPGQGVNLSRGEIVVELNTVETSCFDAVHDLFRRVHVRNLDVVREAWVATTHQRATRQDPRSRRPRSELSPGLRNRGIARVPRIADSGHAMQEIELSEVFREMKGAS